ncbi:MAG: hypothetical protein WBG82_10510 [Parvibaculum sp.]|uniref:hypothetical protein n=1 Tax=Parvibaculum sp. TaxID=2024848 RepID=UPI003C724C1B
MTIGRLTELLAAYGADPKRWPADERPAAEAMLAASADARALAERERELDLMLDAAPDAEVPAALIERLVAARPRPAVARPIVARPGAARQRSVVGGERGFLAGFARAVWPYGSPALPAGALAASIVLGIAFGAAMPSALGGLYVEKAIAASSAGDPLVSLALADNEYPEEWRP